MVLLKKQTLRSVFPKTEPTEFFNEHLYPKIVENSSNNTATDAEIALSLKEALLDVYEVIDLKLLPFIMSMVTIESQAGQILPSLNLKWLPFFLRALLIVIDESLKSEVFPEELKRVAALLNIQNGDIEQFLRYRPKTNLHLASKNVD